MGDGEFHFFNLSDESNHEELNVVREAIKEKMRKKKEVSIGIR